jgi:hypothetical protein
MSLINSLWSFSIVLLAACTSAPVMGPETEKHSHELQEQLVALDDRVDQGEAARLATISFQQAGSLAREYRAVRPPWIHNVLVNNGFRERGLCFEWANDLFERLYRLDCKTLELHLAVARMDTRREHNAVLVTARGAPFESGVILDAWRFSGRLWFGAAARDKYPWVPLPADRVNPRVQELVNMPAAISGK